VRDLSNTHSVDHPYLLADRMALVPTRPFSEISVQNHLVGFVPPVSDFNVGIQFLPEMG
jgi:hypothetical protein